MFTLANIRHANLFVRLIASTVILTFSTLILSPTVMAAKADLKNKQQQSQTKSASEQAQLSQLVVQAKELYLKLQQQVANNQDNKQQDISENLNQLSTHYQQALNLDETVSQQFEAEKQWLEDKNLSPKLKKRQQKQWKHYRREMDSFIKYLEKVLDANDKQLEKKLKQALKHLDKKKLKKSQQPFDPNNLPHRNLQKPKNNQPKTDKQQFIDAGLYHSPLTQVAALGDFTYDKLPEADNPAYLAASDEIILSDAIKAKAMQLNYDPVKIYHYVLNEIEWQPTWGAIQDADLTLSAQRGNAMDISSLLLALLRASKIPARYVHGSIDIEKERFNNWVGNFQDINAGMTFAASGCIPLAPVTVDGVFTKIRMEHIWVEAAIDFHPSRGAKNKAADSWVEMDASFKQYEYLQGLDVETIAEINPEQIATDFINSGTINEDESYVQGLNSDIITNLQEQVKTKLTTHIDGMDNPTVGDVIGGRKTIIKNYPVLPRSLSNKIIVEGARYDKLPGQLQHRLTIAMSQQDIDLGGGKSFAFAQLNNQQVTLSFKPATTEDEAALNALLPEGEITDASQLPARISSNIHVIPELKLNGETVLSGNSMPLGEEIDLSYKMTMPTYGSFKKYSPVTAGSYLAITTVGGNVSPDKLQSLKAKVEQTKGKLESNDQAQLASITREDILGDLFYAGALGYFAEFNALSHVSNLQSNTYSSLLPSFGTYGYEPEVSYFFGLPRSIETGGIAMDLDSVTSVVAVSDGDETKRINTAFQLGILSSALEHAIPEQMFSTAENPADAISAVKALQKASVAGQRIYHITNANKNTILPNIHHNSLTMSEIRDALNAGKEVITHTDSVSVPGWSGAGYILFDPDTGSGAYKISGGMNGGILFESPIDNLPIPTVDQMFTFFSFLGAGLSGFSESVLDSYPGISDKKFKLALLFENMAKIVGASALAYTIGNIALDENLTTTDKIFQVVMTLLAYKLSEALGGFAGKYLFPGTSVAASLIFSFLITILTIEISTTLFTYIDRKYWINNCVFILKEGARFNYVRLT